jgi:hypothetical protein
MARAADSHWLPKRRTCLGLLRRSIRRTAEALGYQVHRWPNDLVLHVDYPVRPAPRWGYGRSRHPQITAALELNRAHYAAVLNRFSSCEAVLRAIPYERSNQPEEPFWSNGWLPPLDAASLVGFLLTGRPKRYIEIGSGNSTMFARHAIRKGGLSTTITSIDPQPRALILMLSVTW